MRLMIAICVLAAAGAAQTMVESAILTGASAAAGAKAKGTGDSISKIFGKVNGTLAGAAAQRKAPASSTASSVAAAERALSAAPAEPKPPKPSKADFEGVEQGMPRADLIAKVGKPASALSMSEDGRLEETLRFHTKEGSSAKVKVTDGKVSSIEWWPAQ